MSLLQNLFNRANNVSYHQLSGELVLVPPLRYMWIIALDFTTAQEEIPHVISSVLQVGKLRLKRTQ